METQAKLGDSEVVPLRYQIQRLQSEMDSMSTHTQWLDSELKSKHESMAALRATHAAEVATLRTDMDAVISEKENLFGEASNLKRQLDAAQGKMEQLSKELMDARQEASDNTMSMEQELFASRRLVELQKEQIERLQQKHDSMASQMEALQEMAKQAEQEGNQELRERELALEEKTKKIIEDQAGDYKRQLEALQEQLAEANKRRERAEEGLLLTNAPSARYSQKPLAIREGGENESFNLTDLHSKIAEAEDKAAAEKLRRKKAEIMFNRLRTEINAKAPQIRQQAVELDMAVERLEDYKSRLQVARSDAESARAESSEMQLELGRCRKRNRDLELETVEMAKQVQSLLVSRSSTAGGDQDDSGIPTAVAEMQSTNQQLLREHREMKATITDLEGKLKSDTLKVKVETYEKEIGSLREERKRQQDIVNGIVQQRDLYRALVHKNDANLLGSPSEETSALQILKEQSGRTKALEGEKNEIQTELAKARAELDAVSRDKEATSERLARYDALNADLSSTVDRLQLEVSTAKANMARSEADAAFHRDKAVRLEEALQRSRDETSRVAAARSELQQINTNLQKAVSDANAAAARYSGELEQVRTRHRFFF